MQSYVIARPLASISHICEAHDSATTEARERHSKEEALDWASINTTLVCSRTGHWKIEQLNQILSRHHCPSLASDWAQIDLPNAVALQPDPTVAAVQS